ncbi:hypothetical protein [Streptomyces sp. NPDC006270]|uniref:hypothetical protein n=1 Tax=Streptomyces sp. NPDC006270 TaxID=3364741 RepID=UPI0036815868
MSSRQVGAALAAVMAFALGWGIAGVIGMECAPHPKAGACAIPDTGWKHFVPMAVSPFLLAFMVKTDFYRTDWRPALGYSAGAVAGAGVVLVMGTSLAYWVAALGLVLTAAVVPWVARYNTDEATRAREVARKQRLREERTERARVRRRERQREQRSEP